MSANHGTIQHEILIVRIVRQILKDSFPHACFGPAGEALMDGFVLTVPLRQVMPMSTRADHPKNGIHKQPIISARPAWV